MSAVIGWDIGGANIKAVRLEAPDATTALVLERPFALWREPQRLAEVLADMARQAGPAPLHAVTMTAELADCFRTKAEGVRFVVHAAELALGKGLHIYGTDGRFRSPAVAADQPLEVAAANWHAAASRVAGAFPEALLVDVGSTTTDIIPILGGRVAARGRTDTERLASGELVYTGVLRTPVCATLNRVRLSNGWCRLAAEHFAIAADAHAWLGRLDRNAYSCATPDGRGTSREEVAARLARMVCADPSLVDPGDVTRIARQVVAAQTRAVAAGIRQVLLHSGVAGPLLTCGLGERLAREAASVAGLAAQPLAEAWGEDAARAAPAAAVAALLAESTTAPGDVAGLAPSAPLASS